ncbi:MAG: glycosyltransferase family 4 protein [Candidatus Hodarchaeota archaeon]
MKICFDARVIINHKTGLGNYTYNLLKYLLEIDKNNLYIVLINKKLRNDHPLFNLKQDNIIEKIVNIPPVSFKQQYLLPMELFNEKFDLYHYPNWDVPILQKCKTIFTIHDLTYLLHKNLYVNFSLIKRIYTRINIYLGLKKAKKIIAVSENTKRDLLKISNIPSDKIRVIYESCEDIFKNSKLKKEKNNQIFNLKKIEKYFLFVGEKRPHKNLIRIINAFHLFKNRYNNYKLIIAGKQYAEYEEPEQLVKKLDLINDIIFYDYVDIETLINLYQKAEALLFVSIYEGFGIPILEAMACGTPVITSNLSSMPEIAGDAALTVNPYNINEIVEAMTLIVQDVNLRYELVKNGFKRIMDFSWKKAAEQTLKLYESVLNN